MAGIDSLYGVPQRKRLTPLDMLYGAGEMLAAMGTGTVAQLGGGLSYLPAYAMGGDAAAQQVMRAVQDAYTYQPTGPAAQQFGAAVGNVVAPIAKSASVGAQTFANNVYNATGSPVLGAAARAAPTAIDLLVDRARIGGMGRPARNEITAYHGTPHDFDEFDISKIGTGEGAQAYGHGLYFADSPDVAGEYATRLSSALDSNIPTSYAGDAAQLVNDKGSVEAAIRFAEDAYNRASKYAGDSKKMADQAAYFSDIKKLLSAKKGKGRLYTVDIPDEHVAKMLDWDKRLSEQSKSARESILKMADEYAAKYPEEAQFMRAAINADAPGSVIYKRLTTNDAFSGDGRKEASAFLAKHGIPGIRYLDQGSRGAGNGTRNTVVFDDKLVKILSKK